MTDKKSKSKKDKITEVLEKGAISEIRKKAIEGKKDEFGIPFTSHYKFLTGKHVEAELSVGGLANKNYVNPVTIKDNRKNR